jgi:hypothetical protein
MPALVKVHVWLIGAERRQPSRSDKRESLQSPGYQLQAR